MNDRLCACGCGGALTGMRSDAKWLPQHREAARALLCPCGNKKARVKGARYCANCQAEMREHARRRAVEHTRVSQDRERRKNEVRRRPRPDDPERQCRVCEEWFPPEVMFNKAGTKFLSYCPDCRKAVAHELRLRRVFGITGTEYYRMLEAQNGVCAICGRAPRTQRLAVDHNHKTGEIRGLLCTRCNHKVLGGAGEDSAVLRNAADYLDNPPARGENLTTPDVMHSELKTAVLAANAEAGPNRIGVVVMHPRGVALDDVGEWWAVLRFADFAELVRSDATHSDGGQA